MSGGVRLHPNFGLNPTISQCLICGKEKNEIVLLGASYRERAPMSMVTSVEPCGACRENYLKEGTLLVEAERVESKKGKPKVSLTGNFIVLKDEAFSRLFNVAIPKGKICFVEPGVIQRLQEGG